MSIEIEGSESVLLCHDRETGLRAVIAIDDTTLGPAVGGVRWRSYPSDEAAIAEARRLAAAMTLKNAAAELPFGGGKSVITAPEAPVDRRAVLTAFGRFVARLGGAYIPGVDMGTGPEDLAVIGTVASDVSCDKEDPSGWTALGVYAGIRAAVARREDLPSLKGATVAIQGAGHVGAKLAGLLAGDGAHVLVADVDTHRATAVAAGVGGEAIDPAAVLETDCDVFAPCAIARVIDATTIDRLRCAIVAGAANDTLADRGQASALAARGIDYVPDFLLNAGGVIYIHAVREGWDDAQLRAAVLAIGDRVDDALTTATRTGGLPLDAAEARAFARLGRTTEVGPIPVPVPLARAAA
jgi:leucine dehydrogenase